MTKTNLKNFRNDFANAMKALEEKYGVTVEMKNISYTQDSFTTKIEVVNESDNREQTDFERNVVCFKNYGLTKNDYKKVFKIKGEKFYLVGINPRARKYPFILRNEKGDEYSFTANALGLSYDIGNWTITVVNEDGTNKIVNI